MVTRRVDRPHTREGVVMKFEIVVEGDVFSLYSIVDTAFGGDARNFIAEKKTRKEIEEVRDTCVRLMKHHQK